jgi:hypothetical protein
VEAVPLNAAATDTARQRYEVCNGRPAAMKACIETGNLRNVGQTLCDSLYRGKVVRLVEWSERYELAKLSEQLRSDDRRTGMTRATMHNSMTYADDMRSSERRTQPLVHVQQCGTPVANRITDRRSP